MKEIATRLHENRQIELAKSILESAGYSVRKKRPVKESNWGDFLDTYDDVSYMIDPMYGSEGKAEVAEGMGGIEVYKKVVEDFLGGNLYKIFETYDGDEAFDVIKSSLEGEKPVKTVRQYALYDLSGMKVVVDTKDSRYLIFTVEE